MSSQNKEKEKIDAFQLANKDKIVANFGDVKKRPLELLQFCQLPRMRLSPGDAQYCAKFLDMTHKLIGSNFQNQLETVFNLIMLLLPNIKCCSEKEAFNMGLFQKEILQLTENWNNEKEFEKDIRRIGLKFDSSGQKTDQIEKYDIKKYKLIILLMFKKVTNAIEKFQLSKNTAQSRNVLIIQNIIKKYYPGAKEYAESIIKALNQCFPDTKENKTQHSDILVMATAYKNDLLLKLNTIPSNDQHNLRFEIDKQTKDKPKDGSARQNSNKDKKTKKDDDPIRDKEKDKNPEKEKKDIPEKKNRNQNGKFS